MQLHLIVFTTISKLKMTERPTNLRTDAHTHILILRLVKIFNFNGDIPVPLHLKFLMEFFCLGGFFYTEHGELNQKLNISEMLQIKRWEN